MKLELQIAFRDMAPSDSVEADIRKHVEKLELLCDRIVSCRVTVQAVARHKQQGKLYSAHVDVKVPGAEIASSGGHESEDAYVAIRDSFETVKRRVQEHMSKLRG